MQIRFVVSSRLEDITATGQMEWQPDIEDEEPERPRDPMVDQAKDAIRLFFRDRQTSVFYQQQLAVLFEDVYFH